jgi:3-oxoadipate enol-lactonase
MSTPVPAPYDRTAPELTAHTLDRQGCPLHYFTAGPTDAPVVICTHGATMDHRMFNAQIAPLIESHRVITWDARGHGLSQPIGAAFTLELAADDLVAILDAEGIDRAVLVGQSMGGYIAQQVYLRHRDRVQAMVSIGAGSLTMPYSWLDITLLKLSLPLFNIWPYNHFTRTVANNTSVKPDVQVYARHAINQIAHADFLAIWKAVTLCIDTQGIPDHHVDVPLLLTHGDQDGAGTIKRDMPRWAEIDPHAEFTIIPDAGHNANQDNAPFFNRLLLDFLTAHRAALT